MTLYAIMQAFQSTLPIREETWWMWYTISDKIHFNPLFPYGKRRDGCRLYQLAVRFQSTLPIREETYEEDDKALAAEISIHSSHTGRDMPSSDCNPLNRQFQSTLPIREETDASNKDGTLLLHFNPLFPYGKRLTNQTIAPRRRKFQSTLPIREETTSRPSPTRPA